MSKYGLSGPPNRLLTTLKFMRDPYHAFATWQERYGPNYLIKAMNGDVVITCNPENLRRLFAAHSDAVGQFAVGTVKPLLGGTSVILIEGEQHRRERAVLSPSFHGEQIADQAEKIHQIALRIADPWRKGDVVRIMDPALEVSLEVIIRVVFGVQTQERVEQFKVRIKRFVSSFHPLLAFSKLLQRPLLGLSPWNRFLKARTDFYELLNDEIEARRSQSGPQNNLLSRLLQSRYEDGANVQMSNIRDQLVTMLFAGHETTQIAIAWAMSWLHRYPDELSRLRTDLDSSDSLDEVARLDRLTGVCNEALRIRSVVPDMVRVLKKPLAFEELELPAGANVGIPICLIHVDPELYPDPLTFRPDRWMERNYKPYEFLPFGGGVRRCIGATLAMLEMKVVIATWVKHFRFSLPQDAPDAEPTYRRNITMAPKTGIPLVYEGPRYGLSERGKSSAHAERHSKLR